MCALFELSAALFQSFECGDILALLLFRHLGPSAAFTYHDANRDHDSQPGKVMLHLRLINKDRHNRPLKSAAGPHVSIGKWSKPLHEILQTSLIQTAGCLQIKPKISGMALINI